MNSHQESRLSTLRVILQLFYDNKELWKGNKLIEAAVQILENFIKEIVENSKLQQTPISGFAKDKKKFRDFVDKTTHTLCMMFCAYASNTGNETIYDEFNMSISTIAAIQDNEMPTTIEKVREFANKNKDLLKEYGPIDELISNYGKEEHGYINYLSKPTEGKAIRAAATKDLVKNYSTISSYLKKTLDKLMIQFEITAPKFYNQYKESRNIYDNPSHRASLLGFIDNEDTNKREEGVTITAKFKAGADFANVVKTSGKTGYYGFQKLEPGIWIIIYEKFGFDTITIEVEIIKGKSTRRNIKIRPTE